MVGVFGTVVQTNNMHFQLTKSLKAKQCLHLLSFLVIAWQINLIMSESRVVCYYTNWSIWRQVGQFKAEYYDPHLCTHLIYAFATFDNQTNLALSDETADITYNGFATFTGLKNANKNLKTLISLGGWNQGSEKFSKLAEDPKRRKEFSRNAIQFLRKYNFDGLDLDWQNPTLRIGGKVYDRANYVTLVKEIRENFERESEQTGQPKLLLTAAIPANAVSISNDTAYDIQNLIKYVDWMSILGYDYHTSLETAINHHSPLYSIEQRPEDADLNVNFTVSYFLKLVAEIDKLQLGIPTYGRSFLQNDLHETYIGSASNGPGYEGNSTQLEGYLAYFEICEKLNKEEGWVVKRPYPEAMGPYAYNGDEWIGYDDEFMVKQKAEFAVKNKLGGIVFWNLDLDDFQGICNNTRYPLIRAAKKAFLNAKRITDISILDFTCKRKGFFSNPQDSQGYYYCGGLEMMAKELKCRDGYQFSKTCNCCVYGVYHAGNIKNLEDTTTEKSTTTLKATMQEEEKYYEEVTRHYDSLPNPEESYNIIEELIHLIKKAGGIEGLEKKLDLFPNQFYTPTTTTIPKSDYLYEQHKASSNLKSVPAPIKTHHENEALPTENLRTSLIKPQSNYGVMSEKYADGATPLISSREVTVQPMTTRDVDDLSSTTRKSSESNLLTSLILKLNDSYSLDLKLFKAKK